MRLIIFDPNEWGNNPEAAIGISLLLSAFPSGKKVQEIM